jgi:hypothetical protein
MSNKSRKSRPKPLRAYVRFYPEDGDLAVINAIREQARREDRNVLSFLKHVIREHVLAAQRTDEDNHA